MYVYMHMYIYIYTFIYIYTLHIYMIMSVSAGTVEALLSSGCQVTIITRGRTKNPHPPEV